MWLPQGAKIEKGESGATGMDTGMVGRTLKSIKDLEAMKNQEILIEVHDKETRELLKVKAIVSPNKEDIPDGDELWIYDSYAQDTTKPIIEKPWIIKVLKTITEEIRIVRTKSKVPQQLDRRRIIHSLLKERMEEKKKAGIT